MFAPAINIGHHARIPAHLIAETEKPRALQILNHLLTLCSPQNPEVWIDQGDLGKKLGIHRDTVGRWIRHLEDIGRLVFLGFHPRRRVKTYRVNLFQKTADCHNQTTEQEKTDSDNFAGHTPADRSDYIRRNHRTINKEEKTNLNEQTVVEFSKKEFSSNEKIALKQKLKRLGVHKHSIEKLITKYTQEEINSQVEHLFFLLKKGDAINKPAAWLITAIEGKFPLPKEIYKAVEEDQTVEAYRRASMMAQKAKNELLEANHAKAKELALNSLEIAKNDIAKEVLEELEKMEEQKKKIETARALLSPEEEQLIWREEKQKKLKEMKKWFKKSDAEISSSSFFEKAVEALVNERMLMNLIRAEV